MCPECGTDRPPTYLYSYHGPTEAVHEIECPDCGMTNRTHSDNAEEYAPF